MSGAPGADGVPTASGQVRVGRALATLLMLLTVFGPISMDLYLPSLPELTSDLGAGKSASQLTVTACLIGLGVGQVVVGPFSDRFGRRRPLLVGIVLYVVSSVLCALAPSIWTLVLARLAQGLAGAAGIVTAQAAGRDVYDGTRLVRYYARLVGLGGLAAIAGPVIGGQLARFMDWRGIFLVLAGIGVALLVASLLVFRETLPPQRRTEGGLGATGRNYARLLRDRSFVALVLVMGLIHAALFSYVSDATFVLQEIYGLSPQGYSYAFALMSAGVVVFSQLSGRLASRHTQRGVLTRGIAVAGAGSLGLVATGLWNLPLPVVIISLFALVAGVSLAAPQVTSLAMGGYPHLSGTAASLLGLTRYGAGGLAAPLTGLGGGHSVLPLGLVCIVAIGLGALATAGIGAGPGISGQPAADGEPGAEA